MKYLATIFDRVELQRLLTAKRLPHRIEPIREARTAAAQLRPMVTWRCVNDVHHPVRGGRRAPDL